MTMKLNDLISLHQERLESGHVVTVEGVCSPLKRIRNKDYFVIQVEDFVYLGTHQAFFDELFISQSVFRQYVSQLLNDGLFDKHLGYAYDTSELPSFNDLTLMSVNHIGDLLIYQRGGSVYHALLKPEYKQYEDLLRYAAQL